MNEKAMKTLEFDKIVEKLKNKCISTMGKELAQNLKPITDYTEILTIQKQTTETANMILQRGSLPLGGIKDIRPSIKRVNVGGTLSIEELINISDYLYVCRKVIQYSKDEGRKQFFDMIDPMFNQIMPLTTLEKEINRCILPPSDIADDASSELYGIRRNIKVSNDRIKEHLNSIIHSQAYKNMLQDAVITIRSERYCIPIKQEYKGNFPGMVHDQSSTGATVFMEPMSVVSLNNTIKELKNKERIEVDRILKKLSTDVAEYATELTNNLEILTELDFMFGKGELSIEMNATEPVFNNKGYIDIKKGRHPLLNKDTVVPTNIYMGKDFTTLLITGPNTGGKTVTLKTIGLFTLMGQAGLHIPAFDHSELSVFYNVFADIGDEQSIEQSLSTFSSHMSNIVKILGEVTMNSLVLLDELGAGTDPTEGAALAIAILEYLHKKQIRTAVTTHYSELKVYALSTANVENASCEFDVVSLRPTYKLLIGIPGKSNAFEISRRLGLPEGIISEAKDVLSKEDARFEDVITDLEISKKTVELEKERAEQFRVEAERLKKEFENQKEKLNNQREKLIATAKEEARQIFAAAKVEADNLMKEMQKQIREQDNISGINHTRQKIKDKLNTLSEDAMKLNKPKKNRKPLTKKLEKNDRVFVDSLNQTGTIVNAPNASGEAIVQIGNMKMKINISNLFLDDEEEKHVENKISTHSVRATKSKLISPEIDLRGCMVDEGLEKCDKYLDDAYLSNLEQVVIIHGKGTGALRLAIQNYLKSHPHVKSYRSGSYGEGEHGVTIVTLKG